MRGVYFLIKSKSNLVLQPIKLVYNRLVSIESVCDN